jgi:hypothetical protein
MYVPWGVFLFLAGNSFVPGWQYPKFRQASALDSNTGPTRAAVPYYYFRVPDGAIHSKTPIFLKLRFY